MEKDRLEFIMERFDKYISNADTKANIVLTVCSGILAIVLFKSIPDIFKSENHILRNIAMICLVISVLGISWAILQALKSINPRTPNSKGEKSIFYFKDIKEMGIYEIKSRLNNDIIDEQINQCIILAGICDKKMKCINKAYFGLGIGLGSIIILSIINIVAS